ncbi:MAG: uroporphyrinogen-III synthase [Prolixibacteraceae bacterium]|nr:uroporphyrinogen-III synthase [Prolixibacteraceae bacterium]
MSYSIFIGRNLADETRNWLRDNNVSFTEKPLIRVEYHLPDFSFFNQLKKEERNWVITSNHVAHWLKKYNTEIEFNPCDTLFCLSQKQSEIVAEIADNIFISEQKNAMSVAELVNINCIGKSVIYLKGDKSLNTLQTEIDSVNIQLYETVVYRNIPVHQKITSNFDAYLFFSPSGIESFVEAGNTIQKSARIFTIGRTTQNKAKQIFSNQVSESPFQEETRFIEFAVNQLKKSQPSNIFLYE